ncbi:MAG: hypothetical protein OEZ65_07205 [Gemmatimonadota bacterium]|nr:hypothetical protein [Gemmatimonadota bacterium]
MEMLLTLAESILRDHPAPAMPFGDLLVQVREHPSCSSVDGAKLLGVLKSAPDRVKILDPARGPWRPREGGSAPSPDAWVALLGTPRSGPSATSGTPALRILRESVRWLARGVDERSTSEVARWHRMVLEEAAVRERWTGRAA